MLVHVLELTLGGGGRGGGRRPRPPHPGPARVIPTAGELANAGKGSPVGCHPRQGKDRAVSVASCRFFRPFKEKTFPGKPARVKAAIFPCAVDD